MLFEGYGNAIGSTPTCQLRAQLSLGDNLKEPVNDEKVRQISLASYNLNVYLATVTSFFLIVYILKCCRRGVSRIRGYHTTSEDLAISDPQLL